jgi:peptidyl-prolyl cis-trans isomerase B (cyclophilin B)
MQNTIVKFTQFILLILLYTSSGLSQTAYRSVLIQTSLGNIECILYAETPMHADNFIELAEKGYFDGMLFHRVINGFMIQSGDPNSKKDPGEPSGESGPGYTIPGEFHPALYHKKGVLAAARQGDHINPNRESSGSQFYIVQGKIHTEAQLSSMEASGAHIRFTEEQRRLYSTIGGAPHLDYAYTVFGEVVRGLEVVDKIASVPTGNMDRPVEDVKILKVSILK